MLEHVRSDVLNAKGELELAPSKLVLMFVFATPLVA